MPEIDFLKIMKQAVEGKKRQLKAKVKARLDKEKEKAASAQAKKIKKAKKKKAKKKKEAPDPSVTRPSHVEDQTVCRRRGCYSTKGFNHGLCFRCYDILREVESETGCRVKTIPWSHRVVVGQIVLISENYIQSVYRGLYGIVASLEDEGTIAIIELTGESVSSVLSGEQAAALRSRPIRLLVDHLLPVEE